ncbi:hypothetical protein C0J52_15134 [Blattella germanica]|nr:hypothetical protein C0J52_15134 [Blattella germanica]
MGNSASSRAGANEAENTKLLDAVSRLDENQAQEIVDTFYQELNQASEQIRTATTNIKDSSSHMKIAYWKLSGYGGMYQLAPNQTSFSILEKLLKANDPSQKNADAVEQLISSTQELKKDMKALSAKLEELNQTRSSFQKGKKCKNKLFQKYGL